MSAILVHHAKLGGNSSVVGAQVGPEVPAGTGRAQQFQHGWIYWRDKIGAHEVHGAICEAYLRLSGSNGVLGLPLVDERRCHDQVGRFSRFEFGVIYWHPSTGAHEVHGLILNKWRSLGAERSVLGYPTSDEQVIGSGRRSRFQFGDIHYKTGVSAFETHGDIWRLWDQNGGATGSVGFPKSDETPTADGVGRISSFENRTISWTPSTGARLDP